MWWVGGADFLSWIDCEAIKPFQICSERTELDRRAFLRARLAISHVRRRGPAVRDGEALLGSHNNASHQQQPSESLHAMRSFQPGISQPGPPPLLAKFPI